MIARSPHPSFEQLVDLVEGHLAGDAAARLRAHVAGCAECAGEVAGLAQLIGTMRADRGADAPPAVVARAVRLFGAPAREATPRLRERIMAALRFDSGAQPLALGLRAAATLPRQLLYGGGEYALDVQITPANDRWLLAGQLLGPGDGRQVIATGPAGEVQAALNSQGEFSLPPLPSGRYALRVLLDELELALPDLDLGV